MSSPEYGNLLSTQQHGKLTGYGVDVQWLLRAT